MRRADVGSSQCLVLSTIPAGLFQILKFWVRGGFSKEQTIALFSFLIPPLTNMTWEALDFLENYSIIIHQFQCEAHPLHAEKVRFIYNSFCCQYYVLCFCFCSRFFSLNILSSCRSTMWLTRRSFFVTTNLSICQFLWTKFWGTICPSSAMVCSLNPRHTQSTSPGYCWRYFPMPMQ